MRFQVKHVNERIRNVALSVAKDLRKGRSDGDFRALRFLRMTPHLAFQGRDKFVLRYPLLARLTVVPQGNAKGDLI